MALFFCFYENIQGHSSSNYRNYSWCTWNIQKKVFQRFLTNQNKIFFTIINSLCVHSFFPFVQTNKVFIIPTYLLIFSSAILFLFSLLRCISFHSSQSVPCCHEATLHLCDDDQNFLTKSRKWRLGIRRRRREPLTHRANANWAKAEQSSSSKSRRNALLCTVAANSFQQPKIVLAGWARANDGGRTQPRPNCGPLKWRVPLAQNSRSNLNILF